MTINLSANSPRVSYTVSAGATTTSFTVSFEFFAAADLNVYVDGALKVLGSGSGQYSVTGGDGSTGSVGLSVTGASGGSTVVITREIDLERTTDFPPSGAFQIATLNTDLDRFVAIAADQKDSTDRSLRISDFEVTSSSTNLVLPAVATRASGFLTFDGSGNVSINTIENLDLLNLNQLNIDNVTIDGDTVSTSAGNGLALSSGDDLDFIVPTSNARIYFKRATSIAIDWSLAGSSSSLRFINNQSGSVYASITSTHLTSSSSSLELRSEGGPLSLNTGGSTIPLEHSGTQRGYLELDTAGTIKIYTGTGTGTLSTTFSGDDLTVVGTLTAGSLVIGSADIAEVEFEMIDGITAGTVAASKSVVVDANKDISSFRNLTASGAITGGSLVIGSADIAEAELEMIDGITAGTILASKAVVVDANKDISSFRNLTATGAITGGSLVIGSADIAETELEMLDGITAGTVAASKALVVDSNKKLNELLVDNLQLNSSTLSSTDSNGHIYIAPDGTGNIYANTDLLQLTGANDEETKIILAADNSDDNGDDWVIQANTSQTLQIGNNISGSQVAHLTITPHATVASSTSAFAGKITAGNDITATGSFIIGSASMNETDLEKIDGIVNGQGAANKALVLDASSDIENIRNVTATGFFKIGNASMNETDLEKLDGITNGTVEASKALVVDSNKKLNELLVDHLSLDSRTLSSTESNGHLYITPNGTGNLFVHTDTLHILAADSEYARIQLSADNSDDSGDDWIVQSNTDNTFQIGNDISGSAVAHLTITPHATVASSTTAIAGNATVVGSTTTGSLVMDGGDGSTIGTVGSSGGGVNNAFKFLTGGANEALRIYSTGKTGAGSTTFNYPYSTTVGTGTYQLVVASANKSHLFLRSGVSGGQADGVQYGELNASSGQVELTGWNSADVHIKIGTSKIVDIDATGMSVTGDVTSSGSFIIGSASINENDLESIDGITAGTVAASKALVVDSNKKLNELLVDNITIDGNDISSTNTDGNLTLTANGTGDIQLRTDNVSIYAASGEAASLTLYADDNTHNGDAWEISNSTSNVLEIINTISGSLVNHVTITPNATVTNSTVAVAGNFTSNRKLTVTAADGVADVDYVGQFQNQESDDGRSFGVSIAAGSNGSDIALNVVDHDASNILLRVAGNGATTIGGNVLVGTTVTNGATSNTTSVSAGKFSTQTGVTSCANNTATTLMTFGSNEGNFLVSARLSGTGATTDNTTGIIHINNSATSYTVLAAGSNVVLSMSGLALQVTQSAGSTLNVTWNVVRIG